MMTDFDKILVGSILLPVVFMVVQFILGDKKPKGKNEARRQARMVTIIFVACIAGLVVLAFICNWDSSILGIPRTTPSPVPVASTTLPPMPTPEPVPVPSPDPEPSASSDIDDPTVASLQAKGDAAYGEGNYTEALDYYERAIRLYDKEPQLYLDAAKALDKLGRHSEAYGKASSAVMLDSKNPLSHWYQGTYAYNAQMYDDALAAYEKARTLGKQSGHRHYTDGMFSRDISTVLFRLTHYQEAYAAVSEAIELSPETASYHYNRGTYSYYMGNYAEAIEDYEFALQLAPGTEQYQSALASAEARLPK